MFARNKSAKVLGFVILLSCIVFLYTSGNCEEKGIYSLGPIVVTASRLASQFPDRSRLVSVLTREQMRNLPIQSLQEALDYLPGVDIKSRNPFGVQGDLTIRGSTFSQVLVLINGMRVNDPQTAHHNLNIPVPLNSIQRIEVLHGPASSLYGADALGGVVNIITGRPSQNHIEVQGNRAENNTWDGNGTIEYKKGSLFTSCSVTESSSAGYQKDTDYEIHQASAQLGWEKGENSAKVLYGYLEKEFGAFDFYTPGLNFPSREWNRSQFISGTATVHSFGWSWTPKFFYRHHFDDFWLDEGQPGLYKNKTKTDIFGSGIETQKNFGKWGAGALGFDFQGDTISSTGLGDHDRQWYSWYGEYSVETKQKLTFNIGYRLDYFSDFGFEFSPSLGLSLKPFHSWNFRTSVGRSFRVPSYTELFYQSPGNKGNSNLDPEHAWSAEIGTDYQPRSNLTVSLTLFYRNEQDVIDWIKFPQDSFWQVLNSGNVETWGLETSFRWSPLHRIAFQVAYDFLDKALDENADYQSKYILNYPRHQLKLQNTFILPCAIKLNCDARYQDRVNLNHFWVLDGQISRKFKNIEIAFGGTNLTDESYEEIPGLSQPGRRVGIRIKTSWDF